MAARAEALVIDHLVPGVSLRAFSCLREAPIGSWDAWTSGRPSACHGQEHRLGAAPACPRASFRVSASSPVSEGANSSLQVVVGVQQDASHGVVSAPGGGCGPDSLSSHLGVTGRRTCSSAGGGPLPLGVPQGYPEVTAGLDGQGLACPGTGSHEVASPFCLRGGTAQESCLKPEGWVCGLTLPCTAVWLGLRASGPQVQSKEEKDTCSRVVVRRK